LFYRYGPCRYAFDPYVACVEKQQQQQQHPMENDDDDDDHEDDSICNKEFILFSSCLQLYPIFYAIRSANPIHLNDLEEQIQSAAAATESTKSKTIIILTSIKEWNIDASEFVKCMINPPGGIADECTTF
jgi:hypothetical protein